MRMCELVKYGVPAEILDVWEEQEGPVLLPVQDRAVRDTELLSGGNLVVQAPTGAGKTFVGEMAAVHTALSGGKVCYLVPLKALAEEKYVCFKEKYSGYGIEVVVSTRDRREFDVQLERGDFSIAVMVYEKMAQWQTRRPEQLGDVSLVVVDELEMLFAENRGPTLDMLLTHVMDMDPRPQVVGMSAVLENGTKIAEWLDAGLLVSEDRPVELRKGVLFADKFAYRTMPGCRQGEERINMPSHVPGREKIVAAVRCFAETGERTLVFVKGRADTRRLASSLADALDLPAADGTIETVRALNPTRSRDGLIDTLADAVAFHNADMSADERRAVESGFRTGDIRVVVSTSTLALGLNLPAVNVFIEPEKWQYDSRFGIPWRTPLEFGEYENMSGRAGRLGDCIEFGRSVLIADSPYERDVLWRRYVEGRPDTPRLQTDDDRLADHVLDVVAARRITTSSDVAGLLNSSLAALLRWRNELSSSEIEAKINIAIDETVAAGVVEKTGADTGESTNGNGSAPVFSLVVTHFGLSAVQHGIGIHTALDLRRWIHTVSRGAWHDADAMVAVAMAEDGRMTFVTLTGWEYDRAGYFETLCELVGDYTDETDTHLNRLRRSDIPPLFDEMKAVKVALILADWIDGVPIRDIEERRHTMSGQITAAAEQAAWLVNAARDIAATMGVPSACIDRFESLATRLAHGVPASGVPLARSGIPGLTRDHIITLAAHGITSLETLYKYPLGDLSKLVPKTVISELGKRSQPAAENKTSDHKPPQVEMLLAHPGSVRINGRELSLPKKQYQLLTALARSPGRCVAYETIYQSLWGADVIVQPSQMNQHKCKLLRRLAEINPGFAEVIKTIPKHGLTLDLSERDVCLIA